MMKKVIIFILLMPLLTSALFAAGTTGKIAGVIKNRETGEKLIGANVQIVGTYLGAVTDLDGNFVILNVPVGRHSVRVSYIGYQDMIDENVRVSVDLTTDLIFAMTQTTLQGEPVVITVQRPMIRRDETNTNVIRSAEDIQNLPIRGLANISATVAGVAKVDNSGTLNIRGGRGNENAIYIDGVLVNDPYNNAMRAYVPNEAIEELSVQTGGFSAEYGQAMSGIIIMTTNAGTKNYSGSIQAITDEFLNYNRKLETMDYKYPSLGTYSYGYNEYTATLGGPIIPGGRHTFFLSGSRRFMRDGVPSWGWAENKNKPAQFAGGVVPGQFYSSWSMQGKVKFQLTRTMELKASGVWTTTQAGEPDPTLVYNTEHIPQRDQLHQSANVTFTHMLNPKTFYNVRLNYFHTFQKLYDPFFGDDVKNYGNPTFVPNTTWANDPEKWGEPYTARYTPDFFAPGCPYDDYLKNRTVMMGGDFDLTHQLGKYNTFKAGFEYKYHIMRELRFLSPAQLAKRTNITELELFRLADVRMYGYDIYGNEVNSGDYLTDVVRNAAGTPVSGYRNQKPYNPIIMGAYIQDKIEFEDLVLNLGLRFDRIDPNAWMFKEIEPRTDSQGNYIMGSGMFGGDRLFNAGDTKKSEVFNFISPRLGISFPVSDKTIFHAQYGKFFQKPDLRDLYLSPFYMDAFVMRGGYFTSITNPNLSPPKTTSYEIGFKQMLSDNASLQLTAFYKETEDLIQLITIPTDITYIAFFENGDFGLVKGFDAIFTLRRSEHLSANVNYEFQTATGTGSASASNFDIAWLNGASGNYPKFVMPLDFQQKHRITVNADYRLLEKNGPKVLGVYPFEKMGLNMLFTFYSGNPYTRTKILNTQPHDGRYDNDISNTPVSAVNAESTPWNYRFDLKFDRMFKLPYGLEMNWYLWVYNVLNTKNVVSVWNTTGLPDQTGYLQTTAGQSYFSELTAEGQKAFSIREMDFLNYGTPRQIRLGCQLSF